MSKTLDIALSRVAALPEAAQEKIGRDLLDRVEALSKLRDEIDVGLAELDAGLGAPLAVDDLIREARAEHGRRLGPSSGRRAQSETCATSGDITPAWRRPKSPIASCGKSRQAPSAWAGNPLPGRDRDELRPALRSLLVHPHTLFHRIEA